MRPPGTFAPLKLNGSPKNTPEFGSLHHQIIVFIEYFVEKDVEISSMSFWTSGSSHHSSTLSVLRETPVNSPAWDLLKSPENPLRSSQVPLRSYVTPWVPLKPTEFTRYASGTPETLLRFPKSFKPSHVTNISSCLSQIFHHNSTIYSTYDEAL